MEKLVSIFAKPHAQRSLVYVFCAIILAAIVFNRLGSLSGGISLVEVQTAVNPVGIHGVYNQPLYLPLKLLQSIVFGLSPTHGQSLTRLPNAILGYLTIVEFIFLVHLWHGRKTSILSGLLFATAAWVLHISRLASFDVAYLWLSTTLLLISAGLAHYPKKNATWFICLIAILLSLYVPGSIWLVAVDIYFMRSKLITAWASINQLWKKIISGLIGLIGILLLVIDLFRTGQLKLWLGLPDHLVNLKMLFKHFIAVPYHLFVRGPLYPDLWLGKSPVLDIFTLACSIIGIYFYATHRGSNRSRMLAAFFIVSWILVALEGAVSLSLLIPLMYLLAAMGIAYLIHEWLGVFPNNPVARSAGIGLISLIVLFAVGYNLRSYFVAWPHNQATTTTFQYHR